MHIRVLGSAAGGGFPQWNCNCRNCHGVRTGRVRATPRTQSSIAVSANGVDWALINASPDILTQLKAWPASQPGRAARDSAIAGVILVDAQIDHATGLFMLREAKTLALHTTAEVKDDLTEHYSVLPVLSHYCRVDWHEITLRKRFQVAGVDGIEFTALSVRSNAPPYSPRRDAPAPGDNVALLIRDSVTDTSTLYAPGLDTLDDQLERAAQQADCVMVDGTFWTDAEMQRQGLGTKLARQMGHRPMAGEDGMLTWLDSLPAQRKVLIHINNSNPMLDEDSRERREVIERGVEVAFDGMEFSV